MKDIEIQAIILDRLMESLKNGNKKHLNLLSELTGELSFKDLRSGVYYLSTMGYIDHNDKIPDNKGFFCKITKEGINFHQDIFDPPKSLVNWNDRLKLIIGFFENAKTIVVTVVIILTIIFGINLNKIIKSFPVMADLLGLEKVENQEIIKPPLKIKELKK